MRYEHIVKVVRETPWAIRAEVLSSILDLLSLRVAGQRLSEDEIKERIAEAPWAARRPDSVTSQGVAILPVYGVIMPKASMMTEISGGTSVARLREAFRNALGASDVSSILLDIDSPGGMVDQVPELASEIRKARGTKPIVAIANTDAASAAYWLGAQADKFYVTPSGQAGSIGVFAAHDDVSAMQEKIGVRTTLVSAGKYKIEGNPFEPLSDEARGHMQTVVNEAYAMFTSDVAKGRRVPLDQVRSGFGEGRVLTARSAVSEGLADDVATFDDVLTSMLRSSRRGTAAESTTATDIAALDGPQMWETASTTSNMVGLSWSTEDPVASAIAPHDTAVVDEPWDGPGNEAKIPNDAGADTLRRMYAWNDPEGDPDTKAAYKMPHHEVVNGSPAAANAAGCRAVNQRLPGSNIPQSDHEAVMRHTNGHLNRLRNREESMEVLEVNGSGAGRDYFTLRVAVPGMLLEGLSTSRAVLYFEGKPVASVVEGSLEVREDDGTKIWARVGRSPHLRSLLQVKVLDTICFEQDVPEGTDPAELRAITFRVGAQGSTGRSPEGRQVSPQQDDAQPDDLHVSSLRAQVAERAELIQSLRKRVSNL